MTGAATPYVPASAVRYVASRTSARTVEPSAGAFQLMADAEDQSCSTVSEPSAFCCTKRYPFAPSTPPSACATSGYTPFSGMPPSLIVAVSGEYSFSCLAGSAPMASSAAFATL